MKLCITKKYDLKILVLKVATWYLMLFKTELFAD